MIDRRYLLSLATVLGCALPMLCHAEITDVIYVQTGDTNKAGELSIGYYGTITPRTGQGASYPGEVTASHGARFTPELYYGLTDNLQVSVSMPTVLLNPVGRSDITGFKTTATWIHRGKSASAIAATSKDDEENDPSDAKPAPAAITGGLFWGFSSSLLATREKYDFGRILVDVGLVGGYQGTTQEVAVNLFLTTSALPSLGRNPDVSFSAKWAVKMNSKLSIGPELYASLAHSRYDFAEPYRKTSTLFGTAEMEFGDYVLHVGVGHGLGSTSDPVVVKLSLFKSL